MDGGTKFNLVVVDSFGSDAVPTHLLTRQAIQLYLDRLAPAGLLLFNVSNKYLNLRSVLAAEASSLGLNALAKVDASVSADQAATGKFPSDWLVLAPAGESLDRLAATGGWVYPMLASGQMVWTDDYSDVLVVTRSR